MNQFQLSVGARGYAKVKFRLAQGFRMNDQVLQVSMNQLSAGLRGYAKVKFKLVQGFRLINEQV